MASGIWGSLPGSLSRTEKGQGEEHRQCYGSKEDTKRGGRALSVVEDHVAGGGQAIWSHEPGS